ncbi:HYD1 signature containing ADP-ribosyltransferase family protein [Pseudomonas wadenswilerensis]
MDSATVLEENWFKYDLNDRAVVVDGFLDKGAVVAGVQAGQNLGKGYTLSYDAAGRRIASERWLSNASGQSLYERSEYAYNDLNQVQRRDLKDVYRQSGANSGAAAQSVSAAQLDLVNTYDERGRVLTQTTYKNGVAQSIARSEYRGDNQKISERTYGIANGVEYLSQANYFAEAGMIDAAGNQTRYRYAIFHASGNLHQAGDYLTTYVGFETYKSENLKATAIGQDSGITNYSYNDRGDLLHVSNHNGKFRRYAVDGDGRMISAQVVATDNTQLYLNYQNGALANAGAISRGAITDTLVPISADYPAHAPSSYVVNQGDTLESIAQMVWGDRSMWYVIADANGLSDTLMVGSSLRIPNVVTSNRNDATTFKPYNPAEVIGDTITPPTPPKPKKKKCNAAASIVMVVVAVVATIFTAGAALAVVAPAAGAAGGTLSAAIGAGMAAVGAGGVSAGVVAAAVTQVGALAVAGVFVGAAVVGSVASQAVGKAMGVVDNISWRQAAVAGLTAGAAQWAAPALSSVADKVGSASAGYAAQGAFSYATNYVGSKIVGLETSFSWRNLAASAVASVIAGNVYEKDGFTGSIVRGQVSAQSSAWMRDKWFGGGRPDYGQVAVDAFGNALADYIVGINGSDAKAKPAESSSLMHDEFEGEYKRVGKEYFNDKPLFASIGDIGAGLHDSWLITQLRDAGWFNVISSPTDDNYEFKYGRYSGSELHSATLLERASEYMRNARVADQSRLTNDVENSSGVSEVGTRFMRAVDAAGFDLVDTVLGTAQLATSFKAQDELIDSLGSIARYVIEHPRDTFYGAARASANYLTATGPGQMAEDTFRFGLGLFGGVGLAKTGASITQGVARVTSPLTERLALRESPVSVKGMALNGADASLVQNSGFSLSVQEVVGPYSRIRTDGMPSRLYHYTDEIGMVGIVDSQVMNPSLKAVNPNDVRYGNGQYFSNITPGSKTPAQLSRAFINNPFQGKRFSNYVEIDTMGLYVVKGRDGVYVIPNETPLDLRGRITGNGRVN